MDIILTDRLGLTEFGPVPPPEVSGSIFLALFMSRLLGVELEIIQTKSPDHLWVIGALGGGYLAVKLEN